MGSSAVVIQGISDPTTLEALACRETLCLAVDLQLSQILVASDYMEVINIMEGIYLGKPATIIQEVKSRAEGFTSSSFVHELRSSNMEAHVLARSSVSRAPSRHVSTPGYLSPDAYYVIHRNPRNIVLARHNS
jgi:hypothetical protein